MRFFTVCAKNYLGYAIALGHGIQEHHPDATFTIFLADKIVGFEREQVPFEIVTLEDVGLVDEEGMVTRYNITELCTALKPYCFLYLFESSAEPVVYLDPDILLVSPLEEVVDGFGSHEAILTPHIVRPVERAGLRSQTFLLYGIYNLGFLGLRWGKETESFLTWWAEKLETHCRIEPENGLFVDQRWADFIPSFIGDTLVLRHEGYNVAYWNLQNRNVTTRDGVYFSNDAELRFVHFSAIPDEGDAAISKRYPVFSVQNTPAIGDLLRLYREKLKDAGTEAFRSLNFGYFLQPSEQANLHYPELVESSGVGEDLLARSPDTYVLTNTIGSRDEYERYLSLHREREDGRRAIERDLIDDGALSFDGYDLLAERFTSFSYSKERDSPQRGDDLHHSFRTYQSEGGYPSRQRSFLHLFCQELQPRSDSLVFVAEPDAGIENFFTERSIDVVTGSPNSAFRPSETLHFDYILVYDALDESEPYDYLRSLLDSLKPGGHLWLAVPTVDSGWDALRQLDQAGFHNPHALTFWSWHFGYLGPNQIFYSAHRPDWDASQTQDSRQLP